MMTLAVRKKLLCGLFIFHVIVGWTDLCGHLDHIPEVPHKIFKSCTQLIVSGSHLEMGYDAVMLANKIVPCSLRWWLSPFPYVSRFSFTQIACWAICMIKRIFEVDPPEL